MLLPEKYRFSICTLLFEHVVGLSAIDYPNGALQNGFNYSISINGSTLVFDINLQN